MAKELLLEIGLEEVPARFIREAAEQLKEKTIKWLGNSRILYASIQTFATPRRLTVWVSGVNEKQTDLNEQVKGPSRKIAIDEAGNWSKAALGFARSQGIAAEALYMAELQGVEYVYARKQSEGQPVVDVLAEGLAALITSLTFPKNMRWANYDIKFVRPIKWITALFGTDVIPIELAGVVSNRITRGHRFLGSQHIELKEPAEYIVKLKEQFVIVDVLEREMIIRKQLEELAQSRNWRISISDDLLEEVIYLVEYPTVLSGQFNSDFLEIPQDVLITSMREHQRYFPVFNQEDVLLPYFVTVRNGNDAALDQVARGNEKVLRARLSDAKFFYQEDQRLTIDTALTKLEKIVFHEELGTVGDKVRRIIKASEHLSAKMNTNERTHNHIRRTAEICKFDLVTLMVYEFPELQGVMGRDYAEKAGEDKEVALGVLEHYKPRFSGDTSPFSLPGATVSLADKMDTIAACFAIGIVPTGSQDPYALRRQASGVVQIIVDHQINLSLYQISELALSILDHEGLLKRNKGDILKDMMDFFALRVKNVLQEKMVRYDIIDAVMAAGFDDLHSTINRAHSLMNRIQSSDLKIAVEAFNRVLNLAVKADGREILSELFESAAEKQLYEAWMLGHQTYKGKLEQKHMDEALEQLLKLCEPITSFFDEVMVMAEDSAIRFNRLSLLFHISKDITRFAEFQRIVW